MPCFRVYLSVPVVVNRIKYSFQLKEDSGPLNHIFCVG
jgi:hypothetical protein